MYGGHPTGRGSPPHTARARGGRGIRRADSLQPSISSSVSRESKPNSIDSTQRPPEPTPRVPPLKALHALCGIDAGMHIVPHRSSPRCEGSAAGAEPRLNTIKSQFVDWYKCGSRTRDTRFTRPLLYPSELTCGGMKQSGRAVRACATRSGAQARQVGLGTHCRCTIDVSTSSRDHDIPQSQILHLVLTNDFSSPKTTRPRSAVPSGVSWRDCSGACHLVSPATDVNWG